MKYKTILVFSAFLLIILSAVSFAEVKTITKTIKQSFGGSQSPDDARIAAIAKVKREALEEAGMYIESMTIIKNAALKKDEVVALAAGILKTEIVSQRNYAGEDSFGIEVVAKVQVDTGVLNERVQRMLNDRELLNKYQESQQRENELLSRIRELEAQNLDLKDSVDVEKKKSLEQEFKKASRGLTANELNVKALALWNNGMYTDAERAIEYLNQAIGLDPDYYATYNHLGMAYFSKGDYESAVEHFRKSLELGLKKMRPDHLDFAVILNNIGQAYISMGNDDLAIKFSQKALEIYRMNQVHDQLEVVPVYNALGSAYFINGEYVKALENQEKALEITLKEMGADEPILVSIYNNIGATYYAKGEYEKTLQYYQKAYQILLKEMGPGHLYLATIHTNFGKTYRVKGDYDKAIEHFQKALKILLKNVGPKHPEVAPLYIDLGSTFYNKGKYDRSLENYQKALDIQLKYLGADHPYVAITYNNFGQAYRNMGKSAGAKEHFQQALQIALKRMGADDPYTKIIQRNLETVDQPHARIETVSGDAISFHLKNTDGLSPGQRLDVSLSDGFNVVPFGSWCIDTFRRDSRNNTVIISALPVETQGKAAIGMDTTFVVLEGAEKTAWLRKAVAAGCSKAR